MLDRRRLDLLSLVSVASDAQLIDLGFDQHNLSVLRRRSNAAAAGPAQAGRDLRSNPALSPIRVFRPPHALYVFDQSGRYGSDRFFVAAHGLVSGRSTLGGGLQRLEDSDQA